MDTKEKLKDYIKAKRFIKTVEQDFRSPRVSVPVALIEELMK